MHVCGVGYCEAFSLGSIISSTPMEFDLYIILHAGMLLELLDNRVRGTGLEICI